MSAVMPPAPALEARGLRKRFGTLQAVEDVSLTVPAGAIYGLIGPNGAGKTTSMRMLATLLEPDSGDGWVSGASIITDRVGVRRRLGYMPDFFGVYPELKVGEYLDFYAACHGVPAARRAGVGADLLDLVDLTHKRESYVEGLSRGMQQRLGLARALVHDPSVLLLDEPASGLDPRARLELREIVRELGRLGKAVVISSHILAELADLCTHIAIVDGGRVLASGPVDEVMRRLNGGRAVRIELLGEGERLRDLLVTRPGVHAVQLDAGAAEDARTPQPERPRTPQPEVPLTPQPPLPHAGEGEPGRAGRGVRGGEGETGQMGSAGDADGAGAPSGLMTVKLVLDGDEQAMRRLLADLIQAGFPVVSFAQDVGGLEDVFLQVTRRLGEGG